MPADGAGNTANFTGVNILADRVITLDSARTIGNITFTDATSSSNNLSISGANILTLDRTDATKPTINVTQSGRTLTISSQISGNDGLLKSGTGDLVLGGNNNFTGGFDISAGRIVYDSGSNANIWGDAANVITFTGNATLHNNNGAYALARGIQVNGGVTANLTGAFGESTNVTGAVTGTGALVVQGFSNGWAVTFSNTGNTFTGAVSVLGGSGSASLTAASLGSSSNAITLGTTSNGGTFTYTGSSALSRALTLGGTTAFGTFNSSGAGVVTIAPNLSITANGAKTLTLGGSNAGANTFSGSIGNSGSGATALTKADGGRWVLSNTANTYTGITTISAGILEVTKLADGSSNSSIGASGAGAANLVFGSGGTLRYTGSGDSTNRAYTFGANANNVGFTINASGSGALELTSTAAITNTQTGASQGRFYTITGTNTDDNILAATVTNNAANVANLTKGGQGKWVLTSANSFTGGLFVQTGTLELRSGAGNLTQSIGNLATSVGEATLISNKSGAGTLSTTFSGRARGAGGSVNIISTGGTNGTDNSVLITGGTQGFIDKGTFFNGADFAAQSATNGFVRALNYGVDPSAAAVGTITASNHVKLTATPANQNDITLLSLNLAGGGVNWTNNATQTLTVPGIIKSGGGAESTISGGTGLTAGTNTELVVRTDASSDLLAINTALTMGSGVLTKSGDGRLTLGGNNTYTGQTHVNAGTLSIGANVNLGAQATGATLNLKGGTLQATATFGLFNGTAGTNNRAVTLLTQSGIDVTGSNTLTIAGVISNNGSAGTVAPGFNKTGTGTLELRGANTYTGETNIIGGVLRIATGNINASSGVTIEGGTLAYNATTNLSAPVTFTNGTISGTNWNGSLSGLTIGANNTISPGNSPGTATTVDQTWGEGGTYLFEVNNATGTAGAASGWDLVNGTGTLTITATSMDTYTIDLRSLTSLNAVGNAQNFDDSLNYAWLIADFASITGFDATQFIVDDTGFTNAFSGEFGVALGGTGSFGGDSSQIYVTYTAIPEPSTMLLGAFGLLALLRRRR